jgi:hypothetical protein
MTAAAAVGEAPTEVSTAPDAVPDPVDEKSAAKRVRKPKTSESPAGYCRLAETG